MSTRSSALKKIEKVYELIETMHSVALQQATSLVHEAEQAMAAQGDRLRAARTHIHQALTEGNREQWAISEVDMATGCQRQHRLEVLRQERDVVREQAREEYGASRIQRGQIQSVVDAQVEAERIVADRRAQNASDDRFLSRLRWAQLQSQVETA